MLNKEPMDGPPPEQAGNNITMDDIREASQLEIYYGQKIMGKMTRGPEGVALCEGAQETGVSIIGGIRNDEGKFIFTYDPTRSAEEFIFDATDKKHRYINIAYYLQDLDSGGLLPGMTATMTGSGKKRNIKVGGFESSNEGESDFDLKIADIRTWSTAMSKISKNLTWIEQQFRIYGIIDDPMLPISDIPMYVAGRNAVQASVDLMLDIEEDMQGYE
jgi:hypothetical protein